jgi:predicted metallo-beta-lactamase superfamily hydrolase
MFKSVILKSGVEGLINTNNVEMILERSEEEAEVLFVSGRSIIITKWEDLGD